MEFETSSLPILQNKELEQNLLGSILINPNSLETINLEPDEFYFEIYGSLYRLLREMNTRKEPIDIVTVSDEITKHKLSDTLGIAEVALMINNTANSFHAEEYAQRIHDYSRRRKILSSANELAKRAFDLNIDIEEGVSSIVEDMINNAGGGDGAVHWSGSVEKVYATTMNNADKYKESGGKITIDGYSTGFDDIDSITGGFHNNELIFFAGEPAIGKSILANGIAFNIACQPNTYSIVYSLEMRSEQVARRLVSAWTGIDVARMRIGNLLDSDYEKLPLAVNDSFDVNLYLCDKSSVSLGYIRADIAKIKARNRDKKLGLVLIDYAMLVDAFGKDETERSAYVSRNSKMLCGQVDAPVLLIESVTKGGMDTNSIQKASMRGSGQQFHDADTIMYILSHIPDKGEEPNPNWVTCVFTKVREPLTEQKILTLQKGKGVPKFYPCSMYINPGDSEEVF